MVIHHPSKGPSLTGLIELDANISTISESSLNRWNVPVVNLYLKKGTQKMAQLEWQRQLRCFWCFFGETSIKIPPPNICAQLTRDLPKLHVIGHCMLCSKQFDVKILGINPER